MDAEDIAIVVTLATTLFGAYAHGTTLDPTTGSKSWVSVDSGAKVFYGGLGGLITAFALKLTE